MTLTRTGLTPVAQDAGGVWGYSADPQALEKLFNRLRVLVCAKLERIEPADAQVGGFTEIIRLVYADGRKFELLLDPGVTCLPSEELLDAVHKFMRPFLAGE